MRIRSTSLAVVVAACAVIGVVSCDKNSPPSPISPSQPPPSRIELVAPQEIAPGESVQLTVNAIDSDGSVRNVTGQAQWTPVTSEILQVSSTGIATGKKGGEVVVTARFSGRSASAPVLVLPKGTFRLAGVIRESGIAIADVTVAVISGVGEGLTATSRIDGGYALYGVSGSTLIHAKKAGYVDSVQQLDVTAHRTFDFSMAVERARRDYSGTYTLTISAAPTCPLPDEAKRRVYTATLTQDGPRLAVILSGADFIVSDGHGGNRFDGLLDLTDAITFSIGESYDYYYVIYYDALQIVERYEDGAIVMSGAVQAKGATGTIVGTFDGTIGVSARQNPLFRPFTASCNARTHGFEMVRR